jgi:retron-type reverse transcriptase
MMTLDLSFANIYNQYIACRKNKRNTVNALKFEVNQEAELLKLQEELKTRTYTPGRSVCFYATKPKLREIFAADFKDRIVHHILVDHLERLFEPKFIYDSFACRKNKGIHAGVKRLQGFTRKITKSGKKQCYFLQLDIHNFFMNINKGILSQQLTQYVSDDSALWLCKLLVFHDCRNNYQLKGNKKLRQAVPEHKTLFNCEAGVGLPIGNLNSQFFANVYLNALDQFVKHQLKCQFYVRYCDDFVLLADSVAQLAYWRDQIEDFLFVQLKLKLNAKEQLLPINNGINFLGYIVRPDYLLVRRRVVNQLKEKLTKYRLLLIEKLESQVVYHFDYNLLHQLHATLASYLGHFKMANSHRLEQSLLRKHGWLNVYFIFTESGVERKYKVPKQSSAIQFRSFSQS